MKEFYVKRITQDIWECRGSLHLKIDTWNANVLYSLVKRNECNILSHNFHSFYYWNCSRCVTSKLTTRWIYYPLSMHVCMMHVPWNPFNINLHPALKTKKYLSSLAPNWNASRQIFLFSFMVFYYCTFSLARGWRLFVWQWAWIWESFGSQMVHMWEKKLFFMHWN